MRWGGGGRGGGGCTSALAAVGVLSEAVAAKMVVRRARDRAVPVELVGALVAGSSRVVGSGEAGQASLGGWGSEKSCLHVHRWRLLMHLWHVCLSCTPSTPLHA